MPGDKLTQLQQDKLNHDKSLPVSMHQRTHPSHTYTRTHARTHVHTHTHTRTRTHTHTHTRTHTHTYTHTHTRTRTHTRTHTHTHTHTHTQTHTQCLHPPQSRMCRRSVLEVWLHYVFLMMSAAVISFDRCMLVMYTLVHSSVRLIGIISITFLQPHQSPFHHLEVFVRVSNECYVCAYVSVCVCVWRL